MKPLPPWLLIALAGCCFADLASAQGTSPAPASGGATSGTTGGASGGATGGTNSGAAGGTKPSSGTNPGAAQGTTPAPGTPGTTPGTPGTPTDEKPRNPFGLGDLPSSPNQAGSLLLPGTDSGASSSFGTGLLQKRNETSGTQEGQAGTGGPSSEIKPSAPSFTAPSGRYGGIQQSFDTGQGRFTRPRYQFGASFSMGFDDNTNNTPDDDPGIPEQEFTQVIPAQPEVSQIVTEQQFIGYRSFNSKFIPVFRTVNRKVVLRPAIPEQEIVQVIPGVDPREPTSSVVSGLNASMDVQWANARQLFTFDLSLGLDYYWNRSDDPIDYNGNMALVYVRRYGPRTQLSVNAIAAVSEQQDYSNFDVSQAPSGQILTGSIKADLSYKWTSRFSTDTSVSLATVNYLDQQQKSGNYWQATVGNEFRYQWTPRITGVVDLRYSIQRYYENDVGNSKTAFALLGTDIALSRRLKATARIGESVRSCDLVGDSKGTPYGEMSLSYQRTRRSSLNFSARYGFETASVPTDKNIRLGTALSYSYAFSPRLSSLASINYSKNNVSSTSQAVAQSESSSETYDAQLSLSYLFSRRFTMSARYSYTLSQGDFLTQNYNRGRIFFTGSYNF